MTCDERIEKTLNRAGQTISDLKEWYEYDGDKPQRALNMAVDAERELYQLPNDIGVSPTRMMAILAAHYARAVDIIDRFEWALENVCGERDYLTYRLRRRMDCSSCGWIGTCDKTPDHCKGWYFKMPEEVSAGDE